MCGIVGYIGEKKATPILLDALEKLEYRGYDSAGIALVSGKGINIFKTRGRIADLRKIIDAAPADDSCVGIGHTRWATHGEPSDLNAHPHRSKSGRVAVVHNGIVENYLELRQFLIEHGHSFSTETDSEVVSELIDYCYNGDPVAAVRIAESKIKGSYSFGILFKDYPWQIIAMRKDSPLIIGAGRGENFIASDVPAILKHTRDVYRLGERELAILTKDGVTVINSYGERVNCVYEHIDWDASAAEKCGYPHFMIKEIMEQPEAIAKTIAPRISNGRIELGFKHITAEMLKKVNSIKIIGCGSAYHVGMAARYVFESLARIPVEVDVASEFRYRNPVLEKDALAMVISQSGETADTLAALRLCKERGVRTIGIVNVVGSSIAREADATMYTWAGPEISVATTKAYSTQLAACYLLATEFARVRGTLADGQYEHLVTELEALPEKIEKTLADKERIQWFASKYANAKDAFFIGRGLDYAVALEGSLKFKEISYIHSEAFAAGEMKHGPISLVENGTLVVGILTQPDLFEKSVSNMVEVKSRGAFLMGLTTYGNYSIEDTAGFTVYVPKTDPHFATSLSVIPLQLLAYYVSCAKGLDVDKPRNLAKSVTVE